MASDVSARVLYEHMFPFYQKHDDFCLHTAKFQFFEYSACSHAYMYVTCLECVFTLILMTSGLHGENDRLLWPLLGDAARWRCEQLRAEAGVPTCRHRLLRHQPPLHGSSVSYSWL